MITDDIKKCIDNHIEDYKVTDEDFTNCIYKNADNEKVNSVIKDAKSKKVNDELTKITNNLLTTETNHTNRLIDAIYTIYGKIDNDNLEPYIDGELIEKINNKMYFVFKGGNTIKYWVNKIYLEKMGTKTKNLEEILSNKIIINENESINACSDFDFSLYIDFNDYTEYNEIIKDIGTRILLLRKNINNIINDESLGYFNNNIIDYTSSEYLENINLDLLQKLYEYIDLKLYDKDIPEIEIEPTNIRFEFLTKCEDFILTRDNKNNENMMYTREVDEKLIVSFNNLIQFGNTDFDLFRIKLGIVANYKNDDIDYHHNFKSEIFDLTVLRKDDKNLKKMCSKITEYTNIIYLKFDKKIIPVRIYNIKYILIDLLENMKKE